MEHLSILLYLGAVYNFGFFIFHLSFWKIFGWPRTLERSGAANKAIIQIFNVLIMLVFLMMAWVSAFQQRALLKTEIGQFMLVFIFLFWALRLLLQFIYLRASKTIVYVLTGLFVLGVIIYGVIIVNVFILW